MEETYSWSTSPLLPASSVPVDRGSLQQQPALLDDSQPYVPQQHLYPFPSTSAPFRPQPQDTPAPPHPQQQYHKPLQQCPGALDIPDPTTYGAVSSWSTDYAQPLSYIPYPVYHHAPFVPLSLVAPPADFRPNTTPPQPVSRRQQPSYHDYAGAQPLYRHLDNASLADGYRTVAQGVGMDAGRTLGNDWQQARSNGLPLISSGPSIAYADPRMVLQQNLIPWALPPRTEAHWVPAQHPPPPPPPDMTDLSANLRPSRSSSQESASDTPYWRNENSLPPGQPKTEPYEAPGVPAPSSSLPAGGEAAPTRLTANMVGSRSSTHSGVTYSHIIPPHYAPPPTNLKGKNKRYLLPGTHIASCLECAALIAHMQLRGEEKDFRTEWRGRWTCRPCLEKAGEDLLAQAELVVRKKRNREQRDSEELVVCDVCFQPCGTGAPRPVDGRSELKFSIEFICLACHDKYKRCTDCGGGGGGRIGIGKWRAKELFLPGRKTCMLSHARMNSTPMDLAVWKLDHIARSREADEVLRLCEDLWREKSLTRLAIPEVLEAQDGGARSFADLKADLDQGWPMRDQLYRTDGSRSLDLVQPYIGLFWCRNKSRRSVPTDDGETEPDMTFLSAADVPRMQKINRLGIIPDGYELGGVLFGFWHKLHGTLLVKSYMPFEVANVDDRTFLTVGEFAAQILPELEAINDQRLAAHQHDLLSQPPALLPYLEHLWVVCDASNPVLLERMQDLLSRRRHFLPLDNYLRRHPRVNPAVFRPDPSLIPRDRDDGVHRPSMNALNTMVRWLGPCFNRQRLEETFTAELVKGKLKKRHIASSSSQS